jgi:hypothetical protein
MMLIVAGKIFLGCNPFQTVCLWQVEVHEDIGGFVLVSLVYGFLGILGRYNKQCVVNEGVDHFFQYGFVIINDQCGSFPEPLVR